MFLDCWPQESVPLLMWKPCCDPNIYNLQITSQSIWFLPPKRLTFNQQIINWTILAFSQRQNWNINSQFKLKPWQEACWWWQGCGWGGVFQHGFNCSLSTGIWARSGNTSPMMSRPPDPRVTGLERVLVHCPQAKVEYVNVVHVDFIWSSMISSQTLNCDPPPWETHPGQETVCFC